MAYAKQTWSNLPSKTSPINAPRLNHLETQYDEAVATVDKTRVMGQVGAADPEANLESGDKYVWFKTDSEGNFLDILIGEKA